MQTLASSPSRKGGPLKFIAPIAEGPQSDEEAEDIEGSIQQARKERTIYHCMFCTALEMLSMKTKFCYMCKMLLTDAG